MALKTFKPVTPGLRQLVIVDRSELYIADEIFLVGTGAQVSPVIEVDHRSVGTGKIGELTKRIQSRYFDAVRGKVPAYKHWLTPIY